VALVQNNVETRTVTAASAQFAAVLVQGRQYVLRADTDLWYAVGNNPTAVKQASSNSFLARGQTALLSTNVATTKVAVIRDASDGYACLDALDGAV
jgi:hypothetical protein